MYRNGNYCAFYVKEPFSESSLGANATKDFIYYNLLRAWKAEDSTFPFIDSHMKTYDVRDGSDWERTLKPRLHERLRSSKNIILFLSSVTKSSKALREEIDYGVNELGLPVIVVYPDYKFKSSICSGEDFTSSVKNLWNNLPIFRNSMHKVPTLHVPMDKDLIRRALNDSDLTIQNKCESKPYFYR